MSIYFRRDKVLYTDFSCLSSIPFCRFDKKKNRFLYKKKSAKDKNVILFFKEKLKEDGIEIRSLKDFSEEFCLPRWYEISKCVYLDDTGTIIDLYKKGRSSTFPTTLCEYYLRKGTLQPRNFESDKKFVERVLEYYKNGYKSEGKNIECKDHLENIFPTRKAMCEFWGIPSNSFVVRLQKGWSLEKALTTPFKKHKGIVYEGKHYKSQKELAEVLGVSSNKVRWYLENDKPLSEILDEKIIQDHLGNVFDSFSEMCQHYELKQATVRDRLRRGWSLEKSLTYLTKVEIQDHLGNKFKTYKDMASYWGISIDAYNKRKRNGWSLKDSLTVPINENLRRLPKKKD